MPIGESLQTCLRCGQRFICGDCIESYCPPCVCLEHGHLWIAGHGCGRCGANPDPLCPRCMGSGRIRNTLSPRMEYIKCTVCDPGPRRG